MSSLMRGLRAIGWLTLTFLVLVPLLAAGVTATVADDLVEPNRQAAASVPISYLSGTYASYESKTFATDFGLANYMGDTGARAAADAAGMTAADAKKVLQASQQGDATTVDVTFTAGDDQAAEAGLRAAVRASMSSVLQQRIQRLKIDQQAAEDQRVRLATQVAAPEKLVPAGLSPEARAAWLDSEKALLDKVTQQAAQTAIQTTAANVALTGVPEIVGALPVTLTPLSTQTDKIRMIATAGISALVLVSALAATTHLFLRARRAKGERAGTEVGPRSPEDHEVIPAEEFPHGAAVPAGAALGGARLGAGAARRHGDTVVAPPRRGGADV